MDVVKSLSHRKDDRTWRFLFPFLCGVMMWFSIVLAMLVRAGGGRRRRMLARRALERYVLASPCLPVTSAESAGTATVPPSQTGRRQHRVIVPTSIRLATRAMVRRAVVVVGGDLARSPRMQYHAASLARSGMFDEIVLVGLNYGNQLSETLLKSGAPAAQTFFSEVNPATGQAQLDWHAYDAMEASGTPRAGGAVISTQYLVSPVAAPAWFEYVFPLKPLHWLACTAYRVMALSCVFAWLLLRATCIRVNAHGQMLLTDLIVVQSPPAVPFVGIVKYIARPLSCLYSTLFYYSGIVPASWFHREAMRDLREQCHSQTRPTTAPPQTTTTTTSALATMGPRFVFWPVLLVDWHNYGYSILEADRRPRLAVSLYKTLELLTCAGDINLTVSHAMRHSLCALPSLRTRPVVVLYDVAPSFFGPVPRERFVNEVLRRVPAGETTTSTTTTTTTTSTVPPSFASTETLNGEPAQHGASPHDTWGIAPPPEWVYESGSRANAHKPPRGVVLVGSTSWTPDDDYTILIEALQRLDQRLRHLDKYRSCPPHPGASSSAPATALVDVWVLITGKGPARARFESAVEAALLSSHITVSTLYLQSYDQYSLTLGAADVGLCLHFSSCGKDLPMKGVDMVGSGLPVAALRYPAVGELMMSDDERRHLAHVDDSGEAAAEPTPANRRGSPRPLPVGLDLEECTRGWLFQTSSGLERLLSHLVGLDAQREGVRDILLMTSARGNPTVGHATGAGSAAAQTPTFPTEAGLSTLASMQARARHARASAQTWEENWNDVAYPLIRWAV